MLRANLRRRGPQEALGLLEREHARGSWRRSCTPTWTTQGWRTCGDGARHRAAGGRRCAGALRRGFAMPDLVCHRQVAHEAGVLAADRGDGDRDRLVATADSSDQGPIDVDITVAKPAGHESLTCSSRGANGASSSRRTEHPTGARHGAGGRAPLGRGRRCLGRARTWAGIWPYRNRWNWRRRRATRPTGGRGPAVRRQVDRGHGRHGERAVHRRPADQDQRRAGVGLLVGRAGCVRGCAYARQRPRRCHAHATFDRYDVTDVKLLKMEVHQCFGTWRGRVWWATTAVPVVLDGVRGFAEEPATAGSRRLGAGRCQCDPHQGDLR